MQASFVLLEIGFTLLAFGVPIIFGIAAWRFFRDSPRYTRGKPGASWVFPSHYSEKDIICGVVAGLCCFASLLVFTVPYGIAHGLLWLKTISPLYS